MTDSITTERGTTISLRRIHGQTIIVADNPGLPSEHRHADIGIMTRGGFHPQVPEWISLTPSALRALADLIEPLAVEPVPEKTVEAATEATVCSCGHRLAIHSPYWMCHGGVSYPDETVECLCSVRYDFERIMADRLFDNTGLHL